MPKGALRAVLQHRARPAGNNGFFKTKIVGHRKIAFKFSVVFCFLVKFMVFYLGYTFLEDVLMLYHRVQHRTSYWYSTNKLSEDACSRFFFPRKQN